MSYSYRASCQQPANHSPARNDVRTEHLIGRMNNCRDVAYQVTSQRLTLWRRQILQQKNGTFALIWHEC